VRLSKGDLSHVCTSTNPKEITGDTGSFEQGLQRKAQNSKKLVSGHVNLPKYPCSGFFFKLFGKAVRLSKGGLSHVCTSTNLKKIIGDTSSFEQGLQRKAQNSKKLVSGHVNLPKYPCSGFFFKIIWESRDTLQRWPVSCLHVNESKKNNRRHRFIRTGPATEGPKLKKVSFGPTFPLEGRHVACYSGPYLACPSFLARHLIRRQK